MAWTLKAFRVNAGLTQDELAKALNVGRIAVVHWEQGKTAPRKKNREKVLRFFGCKEGEIFFPGDTTN